MIGQATGGRKDDTQGNADEDGFYQQAGDGIEGGVPLPDMGEVL